MKDRTFAERVIAFLTFVLLIAILLRVRERKRKREGESEREGTLVADNEIRERIAGRALSA